MDVRYRTLGMCFYIQHRCHSALPIQATPDYRKRSMVRFKPYPPPRSTRPTSSQGLPGTDCYPSLSSGFASQPPCGTTSTPVKQQATKTTMDIWWATLRLRRWTPPSSPPTNDRTLAHRKRCIHVFWLLIMGKKKRKKKLKYIQNFLTEGYWRANTGWVMGNKCAKKNKPGNVRIK